LRLRVAARAIAEAESGLEQGPPFDQVDRRAVV